MSKCSIPLNVSEKHSTGCSSKFMCLFSICFYCGFFSFLFHFLLFYLAFVNYIFRALLLRLLSHVSIDLLADYLVSTQSLIMVGLISLFSFVFKSRNKNHRRKAPERRQQKKIIEKQKRIILNGGFVCALLFALIEIILALLLLLLLFLVTKLANIEIRNNNFQIFIIISFPIN